MSFESLKNRMQVNKKIVSFGELMLRFSPPGFERFFQSPVMQARFGGGESNVLVSLAMQGMDTKFISAFPDNEIGEAALRHLKGYGIDVSSVIKKKDSRMGTYYMERGANQRPSRVIYDRAGSAVSETGKGEIDWGRALEGCGWFHVTGITPALSKKAADMTLEALKAAGDAGMVISCDLNYRKKLWNYGVSAQEVMREIAGYADVIIANEEDCQMCLGMGTGIDPGSGRIMESDYRGLAADVLNEFRKVSVLAITLRESLSASHNRWGACISDGSGTYFSGKYDITHIVDRVGGGDSFCAGLIYGLLHFSSVNEALDYAVAASALAHSIEGDANLSTAAEIMALYSGDRSGRIKR